ncbi:MAG: succinate dehydrogenase, cytochrome b556 subunit [Gammaproteobacteria bacterium]|nr:succinate dehydrogenase, cytochrome b556 subunit [Gammaproteobacteria bacterium]MYD80041.1 succinate dehydrogenase, cytochrome b556 subunit [Gammaproteobacteria bacterium]
MKDLRPVFLDLFAIRLPLPGIVSILHRISGVLLFIASLYLLYLLATSFGGETDFEKLRVDLESPLHSVLLWSVLSLLAYHVVAGVRHILMDLHIGESLRAGRVGSALVLVFSLALSVLCGVWMWL